MRPFLLALLALLAPVVSGCCGTPPGPRDWLDVGFRGPAQCFHTFQTAVASDQLSLEYRCLSADFKYRNRLSELAWREMRDQLGFKNHLLKRISDARILEEQALAEGRHRIIGEVSVLFRTYRFSVDFVREDFYETYAGAERLFDDAARWEDLVRADPRNPEDMEVRIPSGGEFDPAEVTEVRVGREWKIDGFEELEVP